MVWKITGDSSGIKKDLQQTENAAKKTGTTFSKVAKGIGVALAAIGIKRFTSSLLQAASDAEETANKFGVVFSSISKDANEAAKNLATNFGLSSTGAKQLLSDTGDLLTGFGFTQESALNLSTQVQELAVDLASFTNFSGGAEGASQALTKALLGERESVKALGISILEKDVQEQVALNRAKGLTFETERQAKAQATLDIALRQSGNAIGDFARSADSYANIQRRITAGLTDLITEAGTKALPAFTKLGAAFLDLIKNSRVVQGALNAIGASLGFVANIVASVVRGLDILFINLEKQFLKFQIALDEFRASRLKTIDETDIQGQFLSEQQLQTLRKTGAEQEAKNRQTIIERQKRLNELNKAQEESAKKFQDIWKDIPKIQQASGNTIDQNTQKTQTLEEAQEEYREEVEQLNAQVNAIGGSITGLLAGIQAATSAFAQNRIDELDEQLEKELEAAGVAEETTIERLQREKDEAIAAGDAELVAEKDREIERAKIEEDFRKKKAQAEYEAQLNAWQLQLAQATVQGILAPLNAYTSALAVPLIGYIIAPAIAAVAAAAAAAQVAAVAAAKPQPPRFAQGGIVPGTAFTGDRIDARVNSGEMILNQEQQANLFRQANAAGLTPGGNTGNISIFIGEELIYDNLYTATQNGELLIDARSITRR